MQQYHKIQSLFKRDQKGRYIKDKWTLPEFNYLKDNLWTVNEKIDGTNIRLGLTHIDDPRIDNVYKEVDEDTKTVLYVGGKTNRAQMAQPLLAVLKERAHVVRAYIIDTYGGVAPGVPVVYYGEGFGGGIQKVGSKYIQNTKDFCLFDVRVGSRWVAQETVEELANELQFYYSPRLPYMTVQEVIDKVRQYEDNEIPTTTLVGTAPVEGYVLRPKMELTTEYGRVISKIKYVDKFWID